MLLELSVANVVIVDRARLQPGEGLCAISGETGAGKSLLLDAISLLRGERARAGLVGPAGEFCEVTAVIQVTPESAARVAALASISVDDQVILRRRLSAAGRSQAWVNDTPVTVAVLKAVADHVIELHAQDAGSRMADIAEQLAVLDGVAGLEAQAAAYAAAHQVAVQAHSELARLTDGVSGSARELEWLRFQEREFAALSPRPGELAELDARHRLLSDAGRWRDVAGEAERECSAAQSSAAKMARRLGDAPDARLNEAAALCAQAVELLRDATRLCEQASERLHADPGECARIEERLNAWHDLARKHADGSSDPEATVLAAAQRISARIAELSSLDDRIAEARALVKTSAQQRDAAGAALAAARRAAFPKLAAAVHAVLAELGMPKARLSLHDSPCEPGPLGTLRQEFHLCANPGMPAGPLGAVASGGEAARVVLACAAVSGRGAGVLVFDEVDSGVGARLGEAMAQVLRRLARGRTVIAVTHTAHIAAAADQHYRVVKEHVEATTRVRIEALAGRARVDEVSAMLGGGTAAMTQAKNLLANARGASA